MYCFLCNIAALFRASRAKLTRPRFTQENRLGIRPYGQRVGLHGRYAQVRAAVCYGVTFADYPPNVRYGIATLAHIVLLHVDVCRGCSFAGHGFPLAESQSNH